jgi:hypothetical protein
MSATQDDKNWFVLLRGKRYGPYTFAALAHAADRGVVDPEAGVWCLGWDEWRIARNVPGLFKPEPEPEPEPEPDDLDEDADTYEDDAEDRHESHGEQADTVEEGEDRGQADDHGEDAAEENEPDWSTDGRPAENWSAENTPLVASGRLSGTDLHARGPTGNATDLKLDEAPSFGLSAGPRMSLPETPSEVEPARNRGVVRIAVLSVLACLAIVFGTGWAAISLGIIRVEFMPTQREAKRPVEAPATATATPVPDSAPAPAPAAPAEPQTADTAAPPPALSSIDSVPDIVADMPAIIALKRADPAAYAKFVKRFKATYKANGADDEMLTRARTALRKSMKHLLAKASTESLLEITEVNLAYMRALKPVNPGSCVALSDESKGATLETNLARDFAPLFQREMAVLERIIDNPGSGDVPPTEAEVRPYLETVFGELKKQPLQTQLLGRDKLTTAEYAPYCDLVIAFYEGVRALPFADAVKLLRNLYTTAAAEPDPDKL